MSHEEKYAEGMSRRDFLRGTAISAVSLASASILAGCGSDETAKEAGKSGETASWETPPVIPESEIKHTVTADVVVVGGGMAGTCAALAAAEEGARVVLLEKSETFNFRGFELGAVGSKLQKSIGNNINREEVIHEIMRWGGYKADQKVVSLWADHSGKVVDWIVDMAKSVGIEAKPAPVEDQHIPGALFKDWATHSVDLIPNQEALAMKPKLHFPSQMALRYVLAKNIEKRGIDVRFKMPAAQLIRKDKKSRVEGVIAGTKGNYTRFIARKGVILCTGDYGHNPDMLKKYIPSSESIYGVAYMEPNNTGDGHLMGMWAGAAMDEWPHCPMYFDIGLEGMPAGYKPVPLTRQPWLNVNHKGERFMNEDLPFGYICNQQRQQGQPGNMKWVVWDAKWPEEIERFHMIICKSIHTPLHDPAEIETLIKKGIIKTANTIDELGKKMGVPLDNFKKTVARYNELAKLGKDLDFGKRPECLTTIEKAPFYACKLGTCLLVTLGGLKINDRLQVLDTEGNIIPGLYAAGNVSGNFFANDYPITVTGVSHGRAFTFGYLAGKNAAAG